MAVDVQRDESKLLLRNLLQHLVDAGRVQKEADVFTNEYTRYIDEVVAKDKIKYSDFQSSPNSAGDTDRIDVLFYTVSGKKRGHVIFNYNSRIFWSIFIIFVPLET